MKNYLHNLPVLFVGIIVLSFCARVINNIHSPRAYNDVNETIEAFQLEPIPGEGSAFSHEELTDGTVSMLTIFASWCGPCQQEHPVLKSIYDESEVYMYGMAVNEPAQNTANFLSRRGTPFDMVGSDKNGAIAARVFDVSNIPQTMLIDANGHIRFVYRGGMTRRAWLTLFKPRIRKLEKEAEAAEEREDDDEDSEDSDEDNYYDEGSGRDENYY